VEFVGIQRWKSSNSERRMKGGKFVQKKGGADRFCFGTRNSSVSSSSDSSLLSFSDTHSEVSVEENNLPSSKNPKKELFKTEMCRSWTETGSCRYGNKCQFAHGKEQIRQVVRHPKYKTKMCTNFCENGSCPYGVRCRFIHDQTKGNFQGLDIESLLMMQGLSETSTAQHKSRLPIFQNLDDDDDNDLHDQSSSTADM